MVLAISAGVHGYINNMENDMLSGFPVSITQSTYDFTSLMALSTMDASDLDYKELANGNKVYVNSLLDTLGTFSKGFEKTNNISKNYIDYVSKIPAEQVNLIQYGYDFNIVNNIYTNFTVSGDLASHLKESSGNEYNGGEMSVAAVRSMYTAVLTKVEEYKRWGSMISSIATFAELPDNFDYVMSQYDVIAFDKNGEAVTTGYTQEELKAAFEAKDSLIMVLSGYKIDDLTLAQYGYFTEDEFLDYAYDGVGKVEEGVTLVGSDGFPYTTFVGNTSKKFNYYPNDCVYTKAEYRTQPKLSDAEIRQMMGIAGGNAQLAEMIIQAREAGDDALRTFLTQMLQASGGEVNEEELERYFQMFRLPGEDEFTEGFISNAYSSEYTVEYDGGDITLPSFAEKDGYENRVELGVKIILQKKEEVSYGCLNSGFYYTNALTKHILESEKESEIVKYITDNGNLESVPQNVDYYYVEAEEDGSKYYVLDTFATTIETGSDMMSQMIGSVTGTTTNEVTAAMLGGDDTPTAIYIYPVDFDFKNSITDYLDAWNKMCEAGETYGGVTLTEGDKITYTDTVGLIINMVNVMINMITIALVAFTALALVVSTVMIGIITYVSVVERVKEIGILRAVGARKRDIKSLFNAETFIIGLASGIAGIVITYLVSLVLNLIIGTLFGIYTIAALPWWQALIMIGISVVLTLISGLIPAAAAAKKDPVVALRTE